MKILLIVVVLFVPVLTQPGVQAQEYGNDVPYQEAVPNFWSAVTEAVSDLSGKERIADWADGISARVSEFFDDMIGSTAAMEDKPLGSPEISEIEAFSQKWSAVLDTCPDCDQTVPLVQPIVEELLSGLPVLRKAQAHDAPLQNYYELFRELEALNPWGTAAFFQLEPLGDSRTDLYVAEQAREAKRSGVEEIFVDDRVTRKTENGETVFYEKIEADQVQQVTLAPQAVSMIHETLDALVRDGGDPQVIAILEELVALVDDELAKAWEAGLLDDFTYFYLFDQGPIQNELVHVEHPLLRAPYYNEYKKVAAYYPRTFEGQQALRARAVARAERMQESLDAYSMAAENASTFWVLGILPSLSAISLLGMVKALLFPPTLY